MKTARIKKQTRTFSEILTSAYADFSEIDLLIEKANINEIIRNDSHADLKPYFKRLVIVERLLEDLELQAA